MLLDMPSTVCGVSPYLHCFTGDLNAGAGRTTQAAAPFSLVPYFNARLQGRTIGTGTRNTKYRGWVIWQLAQPSHRHLLPSFVSPAAVFRCHTLATLPAHATLCHTLLPFTTPPGRMPLCFGQLDSRGTFKQTQQQVQLATSRTGFMPSEETFQLSQPSQ